VVNHEYGWGPFWIGVVTGVVAGGGFVLLVMAVLLFSTPKSVVEGHRDLIVGSQGDNVLEDNSQGDRLTK